MSGEGGGNPNEERRHPRNMLGLLQFCTEMTAKEDTTTASQFEEISDERKEFLRNALASMEVNVVQHLSSCLAKLVRESVFNEGEDCSEAEDALELMEDFVHDLNYASDLYKIGGYPILVDCLKSPHPSIRSKSANIIGETCQNDIGCQCNMVRCDVLPNLLMMVDVDTNDSCKIKALYAISCIIRENEEGLEAFVLANGLSLLLRAMQSGIEKLQTKAIFLMNNSLLKNDKYKDSLVCMGLPELLLSILLSNDVGDIYREHCTRALLLLVTNCGESKKKCLSLYSNVVEQFKSRIKATEGKEEYQEETEYLTELIKNLEESGRATDETSLLR